MKNRWQPIAVDNHGQTSAVTTETFSTEKAAVQYAADNQNQFRTGIVTCRKVWVLSEGTVTAPTEEA